MTSERLTKTHVLILLLAAWLIASTVWAFDLVRSEIAPLRADVLERALLEPQDDRLRKDLGKDDFKLYESLREKVAPRGEVVFTFHRDAEGATAFDAEGATAFSELSVLLYPKRLIPLNAVIPGWEVHLLTQPGDLWVVEYLPFEWPGLEKHFGLVEEGPAFRLWLRRARSEG